MTIAGVLALLVLPWIVLRGTTLRRYYALDAATWLFAWLIWRRLPAPLHPDHVHLFQAAVFVLKLAALFLFLANGRELRWSANRAALIALIVYALVIPSMVRAPIDGDEPYYLLQTVSIVRDFDLDLKNQYGARAGAPWGRPDLTPMTGDPVGRQGQQYSRHEPFLAFLMVPGYLLGGLHGAVATIALFGVLLVRSTVRWMEDEGVDQRVARAVFPLFAFAPPVLFYATRIWPEVPAAFFFVETLRGMREARAKRWVPALAGLVMLKLRFVLVAIGVVASGLLPVARSVWSKPNTAGNWRLGTGNLGIAVIVIIVPLLVIATITGDPTNVHTWRELVPTAPMQYAIGLGGLLVDGMSGMAFQAPFYLFALIAVIRWRTMPRGFRMGVLASLLYLFYLLPRAEWFGGWAPPLRYVVFLMPVLALGVAAVWDRLPRGAIAVVSAASAAIVVHGLAYPWRLFHEFTGENAAGEWMSRVYASDFSRLFPSFVRVNEAGWWGLAALALFGGAAAASAADRSRRAAATGDRHPAPAAGAAAAPLFVGIFALAIALGFRFGREPGTTVHFEDAHVTHEGGKIYPDPYTVMRSTYRGGWVLEAGHSLSFLAREGTYTLDLITGLGATFEVSGRAYAVSPDVRYQRVRVTVPRSGRTTLRCLAGAINVDRMTRDD